MIIAAMTGKQVAPERLHPMLADDLPRLNVDDPGKRYERLVKRANR